MRFVLAGATLIDTGIADPAAWLVVGDSAIAAVGATAPGTGPVIDATGLLVVPGFIDLHTHGGGGFALHTTEPEEIVAYAAWVPRTGTTAFLINVVGVPDGLPERQLAAAATAMTLARRGAEPLGIYLEGPFLNPKRRGAHHPSWLRAPDRTELSRLLAVSRGFLRVMTLAPELPGAEELVHLLVTHGVTVALGHTDATYEQARRAFQAGARLVTHCFNAMPPLLHRAPGPIGALVEVDHAVGELIADGHHVVPPAMRVLIRALGPQRTAIVTDAQPAAGLPTGTSFSFAGLPAHVDGQVARLSDGTLAGSILTMDQALRNLVSLVGVPLADAVTMLATTPARVAGVAERKGRLLPGYDADFVVLNADLQVIATYCRGQLAHATAEWHDRLAAAGLRVSASVDEEQAQ
jgi:N-acetylglucosamine-6-phosphate deacetylase